MLEDFYPTPKLLIEQMLKNIKLGEITHVLDLGAGRGDISDYIKDWGEDQWGRKTFDIDVVEVEPNFQHILKAKEYHLVHDDVLTFTTNKSYDLIVGNFPFSIGDQFLQKALSILEDHGGHLACLVNAETIRNPYTNLRKALVHKLTLLDADIEYLTDEFSKAERPTDVEVALITLVVVRDPGVSVILDSLRKSGPETDPVPGSPDSLVETDFVKALISHFNNECRLGISLIREYWALTPYLSERLKRKDNDDNGGGPLLKLSVADSKARGGLVNGYISGVRHKYWSLLFENPLFNSSYTSNVLKELDSKLEDLRHYDFTLFNIQALVREMNAKVAAGIEKAILDMFDEFSRKYAYGDGFDEGNAHYYNGWKTNKAHKINHRIILPMNGFSSYSSEKDRLDSYYIRDRMCDMVKVFNYLSEEKINVPMLVGHTIDHANNAGKFSKMNMRFFEATFYKKGTCHITFKDLDLLDKFNIFGSQRKMWLPPSYGKKHYEEMDSEERAVIDDFQGKEKYAQVMHRPDYYLVDTSSLLLSTSL